MRLRCRVALSAFSLLTAGVAGARAGENTEPRPLECPSEATAKRDKAAPGKPSRANTVWFDHFRLRPPCETPLVLSLEDGDFFQVIIQNTDPTQFAYTLTAATADEEKEPTSTAGATGAGRDVEHFSKASVTMRHSKEFRRYHVTLALRPDLATATAPGVRRPAGDPSGGREARKTPPGDHGDQPKHKLYPAKFDVWVRTKDTYELSFTGGAVFSGLRSPHFFLSTDDHGTDDAKDDTQTVEQDDDKRDDFRPDVAAVANVRFPERFKGFGLAFGVGMGNEAEPRYFFGPSYSIGRHFLIHAGWAGGKVDRLPDGQELHMAPIQGDATLSALPKRFAHSFYAGVTFDIPGSEDNFKGAFKSSQQPEPPAETESSPAPTEPTEPTTPVTDLTPFATSYADANGHSAKATISGKTHADLTLTLEFSDAVLGQKELSHSEGLTFKVPAPDFSCTFSRKGGKPAIDCLDGVTPAFSATAK